MLWVYGGEDPHNWIQGRTLVLLIYPLDNICFSVLAIWNLRNITIQ